jgi:hypothetical protein
MTGPITLTKPSTKQKTNVGPVGIYEVWVELWGKSEMARRIMDAVRSRENVLPAS